MKTFTLGTLPLIASSLAAPNFILQTPITGLDAPSYRSTSYSKPGADGAVFSSQFYDTRIITLTGTVYATNGTDYEAARQALSLACAIQKDSNGYPLPVRIQITTLANNSYFLDVYLDRPIFDYGDPNRSRFMITATCANPFVFGAAAYSSSAIGIPTSSGYLSPYTSPYTTGASTGGTATINNVGNAISYPMITLTGPLSTNITVTNTTADKFLQINYTLNSGDVAVIDMFNKVITLNGSSSLNAYKTSGADWFTLAPGINSFTFTSGSSSDTGNAVITGYPAFIGI